MKNKSQSFNHLPYVLTLSAAALATVFVAADARAASTFKTHQITASADDAIENRGSGSVSLTDQYVTLQGNRIYGYRFTNVDVPQGAVIKSAYLRFFNGNVATDGALNFTIHGEAVDTAGEFLASGQNISSRLSRKTNASATWAVPNWSVAWDSQAEQKSVDISSIISEIVSRPGYAKGNAIALILDAGSTIAGTRNTYSADYVTATGNNRMVRLVVEYEMPAVACDHTPTILNGSDFIPDYSFAGYRWGEAALPNYAGPASGVTYVDMTTFGVTANDGGDDTTAIKNAVAAHQTTPGTVVLRFPAGRFNLSDVVLITRSNMVIQGAGSGANGTIFEINKPLSDPAVYRSPDVDDLASTGRTLSLYSWLGGFFEVHYDGNRYSRTTLSSVSSAKRGETSFTIPAATSSIKVGDVIRFEWANDSTNNFLSYLLNGDLTIAGSSTKAASSSFVAQNVTVTAVSADGRQITIKEPLLHDVGQAGQTWTARVRTVPLLEEVGLEGFSVVFPDTVYGGHHGEAGYNAIYMADVKHSWVRDVAIHNADSGVLVSYSKNVTLQDIKTTGRAGHYNVEAGESYGVLSNGFDYRSPALHSASFNTACTLCVYTNGYIEMGAFDQHNGLNHQNLMDNVTVGHTNDLFWHGGNVNRLPTAAQFNTFWNIQLKELPFFNVAGSCTAAPDARIVGLYSPGNTLSINYTPAPVTDGLNACVSVPSLYGHQLQNRLGAVLTTAAFGANVTSGLAPLTVQFSDSSSGNISSWAWDFNNDGVVDSTQQNPSYTFNSSGSYSVKLTVTDNLGNTDDEVKTGYITANAVDTVPNSFSFTDVSNAALNTVFTSNSITVSGINSPSAVSVSGGEYQKNGGAWTTAAGTAVVGDSFAVRLTSANTGSTAASATLNIGGVSDSYTVTTGADTKPDQFTFVDQTGVALNTNIISAPVVLQGMDAGVNVSITSSGGTFSINGSASWVSSGTVKAGDSIRVQVKSSRKSLTTTSATVTVGGVSDVFSVKTR